MPARRWSPHRELFVGLAVVASLSAIAHATTTVHTDSYIFPAGPGNIITVVALRRRAGKAHLT